MQPQRQSSSLRRMKVPRREGVEEKKDEDVHLQALSPSMLSQSQENDEQERIHGFQAQVENFANIIFGSCGTVIEAASKFVESRTCSQWEKRESAPSHAPAPLSIAEELRKLAEKEGRSFLPQLPNGPIAPDIPKYLGEDAVHSFEDDNISAISQHTLEELAANGTMQPVKTRRMIRNHQKTSQQPGPSSPTETTVDSKKRKKEARCRTGTLGGLAPNSTST
jgi:hypothetical protein